MKKLYSIALAAALLIPAAAKAEGPALEKILGEYPTTSITTCDWEAQLLAYPEGEDEQIAAWDAQYDENEFYTTFLNYKWKNAYTLTIAAGEGENEVVLTNWFPAAWDAEYNPFPALKGTYDPATGVITCPAVEWVDEYMVSEDVVKDYYTITAQDEEGEYDADNYKPVTFTVTEADGKITITYCDIAFVYDDYLFAYLYGWYGKASKEVEGETPVEPTPDPEPNENAPAYTEILGVYPTTGMITADLVGGELAYSDEVYDAWYAQFDKDNYASYWLYYTWENDYKLTIAAGEEENSVIITNWCPESWNETLPFPELKGTYDATTGVVTCEPAAWVDQYSEDGENYTDYYTICGALPSDAEYTGDNYPNITFTFTKDEESIKVAYCDIDFVDEYYLDPSLYLWDGKASKSLKAEEESINEISIAARGEWFNLQGVRVANPAHGLFIHNGRIVRK